MPYKMTFDVKSTEKGWDHKGFVLEMPVTLDDMDLIVKRYGSVERLIDRANATHKVDVARGMRKEDTPDGAQVYAEGFVNNGKKSVQVRTVVIDQKDEDAPEFSEEHLEYLRKKGVITR